MIVVEASVLKRFVDLLRKKAIDADNLSRDAEEEQEYGEFVGKSQGLRWAADHLEPIIEQNGSACPQFAR